MNTLASIKARLPDWAKDIRLNLDATIARSSLEPRLAVGAALAAAYAARSPELVAAFRDPEALDARHAEGALTAAALMGMNNVWYPFVEMAGDPDLKTMRAELRMNAYATHGGVDKVAFELYALAASIVGKCEFCVQSHAKLLKDSGLTTQQIRDVGRIAATVNAAALALAAPTADVRGPELAVA
ncbi:MAG: carboxymuconolactone decarboxylase family protein [Burkholderiales bacterium]|jgi:lipoyl-dependent peroxiredoxin subunit D|nr:carboxymuconolactone decarboxylase family protein [Burkholderiales bacterium]